MILYIRLCDWQGLSKLRSITGGPRRKLEEVLQTTIGRCALAEQAATGNLFIRVSCELAAIAMREHVENRTARVLREQTGDIPSNYASHHAVIWAAEMGEFHDPRSGQARVGGRTAGQVETRECRSRQSKWRVDRIILVRPNANVRLGRCDRRVADTSGLQDPVLALYGAETSDRSRANCRQDVRSQEGWVCRTRFNSDQGSTSRDRVIGERRHRRAVV